MGIPEKKKSKRPIQEPMQVQLEKANKELARRVDELTHSQKLLAEREKRLSAFIAALPNLSFILDEQGRYLEIQATETSLLVARPRELIGRLIADVMSPKVGAKIVDAIHQAMETGRVQVIEYKTPVLGGGEHWFEGRISCMEKDEDGHGKVVMIVTEISERVQLYQEVQRLATHDDLGCINKRHFKMLAEMEFRRALRYKRPLSLMMLDIDHFKKFNDQYGHQIGDQVLLAIVNMIEQKSRKNRNDIFGRYGGEEFVVLMAETDIENALKASERLRKEIEELRIETSFGKLSITVSMGIASIESDFEEKQTFDALIGKADTALYAAKDAGRNCIKTA